MLRKKTKKRRLTLQPLESRRVLAASLGWDGPGQGSAALTYYIANSPNSLTQAETDAAIQTALSAWSSAADITFTQVNQPGLADSIDISFTNIDGPGRTLAQAYFPDDVNPARIAGDVQFDLSEAWEVGNSLGNQAIDLVYAAVHEIGHSLGLDHTNVAGSVLAPSLSPSQSFTGLSAADVTAIQSLYAPASGTTTSTPDTTTPDTATPETNTPTGTDTTPGEHDVDGDHDRDNDNTPFPRNRWRRGGDWHRFGGRLDVDIPQNFNYINPTDVNGDNATSAADALMIINELNRLLSSLATSTVTTGLCDTNADGLITAADALMVINVMNITAATGRVAAASDTDVLSVNPDSSDSQSTTSTDTGTDTEPETETTTPTDTNTVDPGITAPETTDPTDTNTVDPGTTDPGTTDPDTNPSTDTDTNTDTDTTDPIDNGGVADTDDDDESDCHGGDRDDEHEHRHHDGEMEDDVRHSLKVLGHSATEFFNRFDTNSDGSVTESEVSSKMWTSLLALNIDTNGDGNLSLDEVNAVITAAQQAKFDANDTDGNGLLTEAEVGARDWSRISAADTNEDAAVSFDELQTFLQDQASKSTDTDADQHHERKRERANERERQRNRIPTMWTKCSRRSVERTKQWRTLDAVDSAANRSASFCIAAGRRRGNWLSGSDLPVAANRLQKTT